MAKRRPLVRVAGKDVQLPPGDELAGISAAFIIIYPNGGSAGSPANVSSNSRYVSANPFPGKRVVCRAEIQISGEWGTAGWWDDGTGARGTKAAQYGDSVIVQTGVSGVITGGGGGGNSGAWGGGSHPGLLSTLTTAPCRVIVWSV